MKSRLLPWSRTFRLTQPRGVERTEYDDHVAYRADSPLSNFHHRILLDRPPESLEPWKARWRELNADRGVQTMMFAWEGRKPTPTPEGRSWTLFCMMADQPVEPIDDPRIRRLGPDDADAVAHLMTLDAEDPGAQLAWGRWVAKGVLARDNGVFFGLFEGDTLASMANIYWDDREARYQTVATHPDHRRKGLASLVVQRALLAYQDLSFGIAYVAASQDTPAEALYRRLGFRRTTAVTLVQIPA